MRLKALLLVGVSAWVIGCNKADLVSPTQEQIQTKPDKTAPNAEIQPDVEIQNVGQSVADTAQLPDRTNPADETFQLSAENSDDSVQLDDLPLSLEPPQNPIEPGSE